MATQETARQEAADTLRPHATDPAIADIIASLTGEDQGEDDALEKAMTKISVAREALVKDANVSSPAQAFEVGEKLDKAERSLQREYMARHSAGFAKAETANREAVRLRERGFGRVA